MSRNYFRVVYHENTITVPDSRIIITTEGTLGALADTLQGKFAHSLIDAHRETNLEYLISGVVIKTNRISSPHIDEIALISESKSNLVAVAHLLDLPEIPQNSFRFYD